MMQLVNNNAETAREYDLNGWFEIADNPLSKVGVFMYLGKNIPQEAAKGNHDVGFAVYRPAEELADPDCGASFRLTPWIIDHTMLGDGTKGTTTVDEKGARGVIGEQIWFDADDDDGTLKGNIKCFSAVLAGQINAGKIPLSLGYRCVYEYSPGVFNGKPYTYIQRLIRGNHLATVNDGRMGPEVAVMDSAEMSFTVDAKEFIKMATKKPVVKKPKNAVSVLLQKLTAFAADAEEKIAEGKDEGGDLAAAVEAIGSVAPLLEAVEELKAVGESDELAVTGDADDDDDKEGKDKPAEGKGMDAAEVLKIVNKAVASAMAAHKPAPAAHAMDEAEIVRSIALRDKLAKDLSEHVGTFDHSEMTLAQVAAHGVEKLGLPADKGGEVSACRAWLHNRPSPRSLPVAAGMDAADKTPGFLAAQVAEQR